MNAHVPPPERPERDEPDLTKLHNHWHAAMQLALTADEPADLLAETMLTVATAYLAKLEGGRATARRLWLVGEMLTTLADRDEAQKH
jgi:hypothetical protein